ncbi:MAG: hypothetical protein SGARI_006402, partial [Bacillariaceae sp.]
MREANKATLRWRVELERKENSFVSSSNQKNQSAVNRTKSAKSALRKHSIQTKYCPSGHVLSHNIPVTKRQKYLQELHNHGENNDQNALLPVVGCDACSQDILEDRIGATCAVCDLDFCQRCYHDSGKAVEELLNDARKATLQQKRQQQQQTLSSCSSLCSGSAQGSLTSFNSTQEFCAKGHELLEIPTLERQRYIQDRDALTVLPIIECDCCSKEIRDETIAGCDTACDIDICKDCFKNGQSYEDVLEDGRETSEDPQNTSIISKSGQQRYNGRRPTYKSTGRVSYDHYPDPTSYQW